MYHVHIYYLFQESKSPRCSTAYIDPLSAPLRPDLHPEQVHSHISQGFRHRSPNFPTQTLAKFFHKSPRVFFIDI